MERAVLALDVTDRQQGVGVLGEVLPTEKLVASFLQMAGGLGTQFCDPDSAVLQGITEALRQSSDIMVDRVQNPETECDAVSIGLGFDTRVTTLGDAATPEADSPCAP